MPAPVDGVSQSGAVGARPRLSLAKIPLGRLELRDDPVQPIDRVPVAIGGKEKLLGCRQQEFEFIRIDGEGSRWLI